MKKCLAFIGLMSILVLASCGSYRTVQSPKMRILEPSAADSLGGTGTSSADVRSMAEKMAREIVGIRWPAVGSVPQIAVVPLKNLTRFRVDPMLLQNKLIRDLVVFARGRVVFLARDSESAVMAERAKKRAGIYSTGQVARAMAGADYLLAGEMRALSKASRTGHSDYILYSFTLLNAETGAILWAGEYETKKEGTVGVVYQ